MLKKANVAIGATVLMCSAIASAQTRPSTQPATQPAGAKAVCHLSEVGGSGVTGVLHFSEEGGKVRIRGEIRGLTPGDHGFHVHQFGDCSSPDGKSAGGHFNPMDMPHAGPRSAKRHVGDLGNVTAGKDGVALIDHVDPVLQLGGGAANILGRGVIVHAKPDDLQSQPTGDAGGRVACGIIGAK